MTSRDALIAAVRAGVDAPRNDSSKWTALYNWFASEFGISGGQRGGVIGKVITETKQIGNRVDEMVRWNPHYAVISVIGDVTIDGVLRAMRRRHLPSLRCALFLNHLMPARFVVFGEPDHVATDLEMLFPELTAVQEPQVTDTPVQPGEPGGGAVIQPAAVPLVVEPRVERMVRLSILSAAAVILVGPPGTGKTTLLRRIVEQLRHDSASYGFTKSIEEPVWATPEESWTTTELVGGTTVDHGELRFRPGYVLDAIADDRWLILDEMNRADMDRIFGGLLTWLSDQEVTMGRAATIADAPAVRLGWAADPASKVENAEQLADPKAGGPAVRFLAGREWRLLGTYNAVDAQRVFRFGQAIGRRFVRVPIPALSPAEFAEAIEQHAHDIAPELRNAITALYAAHAASEVTKLGPALFLRMLDYVKAGQDTSAEPLGAAENDHDSATSDGNGAPDAASGGASVDRELLTEAYLVNIGTWLAHFGEDVVSLGYRIVDDRRVLDRTEWDWVLRLSAALG